MQERIEKVATLYIQSHYDIEKMSLTELVQLFDKTCDEILEVVQSINKS
ncbi:hypothetical protein [Clostridium beijerinckii]|uniref:Uncharacterized protein n=1 Tax=Clostridium beijerinckii TaxID=1520 RepID=A0A7X9SMP6_CLOBE|nr:hypothetical protein [Clostridium beijerinckii]NMF04527.1 hypothetical protein [Clostridium beijerinckii]